MRGFSEVQRTVRANEHHAEYPRNSVKNSKYTIWNFLFLNLWLQFGRFFNLYFLFIGCLQLWSAITPVDPLSTWGAIVLIFAISATKEAVDDYHRHARDKIANERLYTLAKGGNKIRVKSEEICVGDVVFLTDEEEIPCDLVLLKTSTPEGTCYVQTANLDGETDLKTRKALPETNCLSDEDISEFRGTLECSAPNAQVYKFDSRMRLDDGPWLSLSAENLILQATSLKNTLHVYGLVVYTANETKIGQNKKTPPTKWTKLDHAINRTTMGIFTFQFILVLAFGLTGEIWRRSNSLQHWYLSYSTDPPPWEFLIIPLRFLLLNSTMIPISLKVSLDLVKYFYAQLINWDLNLYHQPTDTPAVANSTAITEDLGQIEYVFTDKTGTLTENVMLFKSCYIDGEVHAVSEESGLKSVIVDNEKAQAFVRALALCHTVVPVMTNPEKKRRSTLASPDEKMTKRWSSVLTYQSSSPDEEALVKGASVLGMVLHTRKSDVVTVSELGSSASYTVLHTLEFTSNRKRMSVVVRDSSGKLMIITKGADDMILPRLSPGSYVEVERQLEEFAKIGLRTLCVTHRRISNEEYFEWQQKLQAANTAVHNREAGVAAVYELIERDLTLLGLTAIEDKLQEGVAETIATLRAAGIKVWMLTGDKYSTALQIGTSCNLVSSSSTRDVLTVHAADRSLMENLKARANGYKLGHKEFTLIIEGSILATVLDTLAKEFVALALMAAAVICCRVTPAQKALVVKLIKDLGHVTLSIGDGGNDVSMIQEASVGVGIVGREGLQASRAADFSIARFCYLTRLILIHGRYAYHRTAFVANYSFYKSLFICFLQIGYQYACAFSGTSFFNSFALMSYNVIFTGLPILGYVLDKDVTEEVAIANPVLYQESQKNEKYSLIVFSMWIVRAFAQAIFTITTTVYIFSTVDFASDYYTMSMVPFTAAVVLQALTVMLEANHVTILNHVMIWGTIIAYFVVVLVANVVPTMSMYYTMFTLFGSAIFWISFLFMLTTLLLPVLGYKYYRNNFNPSKAVQVAMAAAMEREAAMKSPWGLERAGKEDNDDKTPLLNEFIL